MFKQPRRYMRGDRIYIQAQQIWQILVSQIIANQYQKLLGGGDEFITITYGNVASMMGNDPRAGHQLGRQLWIIGEYCTGIGLPALNSIVVRQDTHLPGDKVVLTIGNNDLKEIKEVNCFPWVTVGQPTAGTFRKVWEVINA